jgi:hypothetical protein
MSLSRREFLKYGGLAAAGFVLPSLRGPRVQQSPVNVINPGAPTALDPRTAVLFSPATGESLPALPWAAVCAGHDLQWQVTVAQTGYYRLGMIWQDGPSGWGLRGQIMLGNRILATLYDTSAIPGPVRLEAGTYTLAIRNLAWPRVYVRSLTVAPTPIACPAPVATFCAVQDWHTDRIPVPPHYTPPVIKGWYNRYLDFDTAAVRDQQALAGFQQVAPDFLVSNGDSIHWGTSVIIPTFASLTTGLPFPWYATMGHHETRDLEGAREIIAASWGAALPGGDTSYYFVHAGVLFVFVDSAYFQDTLTGAMYSYPPARWDNVGCTPEVRAWLQGVLAANRAGDRLPVVVFTHHTLMYRQPLPPPLAATVGHYGTYPPCDTAHMLTILQSDPCVRAVLTGHGHFQQALRVDKVHYLEGAAMGEGPMTFLRGLIFSDHLEIETYQPVSLAYLLQSALPTGTWAVGFPGDINVQVPF